MSHRRITSATIPKKWILAGDNHLLGRDTSHTRITAVDQVTTSADHEVTSHTKQKRSCDQVVSASQNFLIQRTQKLHQGRASLQHAPQSSNQNGRKHGLHHNQSKRQPKGNKARPLAITCQSSDQGLSVLESLGVTSTQSIKMMHFAGSKRLPSTYKVSRENTLNRRQTFQSVVDGEEQKGSPQQRKQRPQTGNPRLHRPRKLQSSELGSKYLALAGQHSRLRDASNSNLSKNSNFSNADTSFIRHTAASSTAIPVPQTNKAQQARPNPRRITSASTYRSVLLQPVLESTDLGTRVSNARPSNHQRSTSDENDGVETVRFDKDASPKLDNKKKGASGSFEICSSRRVPIKSFALQQKRRQDFRSTSRTFLPPEATQAARIKTSKQNIPQRRKVQGRLATQYDPQIQNLGATLRKLEQEQRETEDEDLKAHLQEVINMIKLQQVSMGNLYDWSLNNSQVMRQVRHSQHIDGLVLNQLRQQSRYFKMLSQKRTDLYKTRDQLKEQEMNGEIRKYILAQDPQKIPDSYLSVPEPETKINIKFFKAGTKVPKLGPL